MIPRQDDEPEPQADKWSARDRDAWNQGNRRRFHLHAGAWPEISDTPAVISADAVLSNILRAGATYYGLGAYYDSYDYAATAKREDYAANRARVLHERAKVKARREHNRRQARLAELLWSL